MKYVIICILALMVISCNKEEIPVEVPNQNVLIKVEAVHIDDNVLVSPIVLVR